MNDAFLSPSQSTTIFKRVELCETLEPLAKAGYQVIELSRNSANRGRYRQMVADLGLRVWAVHGTLGLPASLGTAEERQATVDAELEAMEEVAAYAPCPYIVHHMHRTGDADGPEDWKRSIERLHERARSLGFVLCVEPVICKPHGFPYHCPTTEVAAFVRSFESDHLGVCLDVNHVNVSEDLVEAIGNLAGLIRTVHLSDNHGEGEEHLPPGEGVIDWPAMLTALYRSGYAGPLNMEIHVPPTHELLVNMRLWAEEMASLIRERVAVEA